MQANPEELLYKLLDKIRVDLSDEFNRNFERKAFFNTAWKPAQRKSTGSLLVKSNSLRKSIKSKTLKDGIEWTSDLPYADIHNSGGTITVTQKMKGYFWIQYRLATGSMQTTQKGKQRNNKFNRTLTAEAEFYKAMALKKVGSKIIIPQRQFIGDHPMARTAIEQTVVEFVNTDLRGFIDSELNNIIKH